MRFSKNKVENYGEPAYSIIFHNMPKLENWIYSKKPHGKWGFSSSTRGRTRTGTALLPTDFKSAYPPSRNILFGELYRTFYEVSSLITTWHEYISGATCLNVSGRTNLTQWYGPVVPSSL